MVEVWAPEESSWPGRDKIEKKRPPNDSQSKAENAAFTKPTLKAKEDKRNVWVDFII